MLKHLFILALILSLAFCEKGSGSGGDDDNRGGEDDRDVSKTSQSSTEVTFSSRVRDGDGRSRLEFGVRTDNEEVEFRVKYQNETSEEDFRVRFEQVIVFNDNNNNGYTSGEEVDVFQIGKDIALAPISCVVSPNTGNGQNYDCSVASTDGSLKFVAHLVSSPTTINSTLVRPTSVKIDVVLDIARDANTSLAITAQVKTVSKSGGQHLEDESEEEREGVNNGQPEKQVNFGGVGFFSWVTTATVNDAKEISVVNSNLEVDDSDDNKNRTESTNDDKSGKRSDGGDDDDGTHDESNRLVFSFLTKESGVITWDPKLSWQPSTLEVAQSNANIAATSFSIILFGMIAQLLFL